MTRRCQGCGIDLDTLDHRVKWCPPCRRLSDIESKRRWQLRNRQAVYASNRAFRARVGEAYIYAQRKRRALKKLMDE